VVTGVALGDPNKVVPPPVQPKDQMAQRNLQGMLSSAQVVPPPPNLGAGSSLSGNGGGVPNHHGVAGGTLGARDVIPPPPSIGGAGSASGTAHGSAGGLSASLSNSVIPPPPNAAAGGLEGGTGRAPGGTLSASNVVPPPPNVASGTGLSGRGTGNKGGGLGGPMDVGSPGAPSGGGGGNNGGKGVVLSGQPGSVIGKPGSGGPGNIAMSPAGHKDTGLGGGGGGTGIGRGDGPGSGLSGEGSGGARDGSGKGVDPNARGGISQYGGPGGAGSGTTGQPAIPGVSVQGGSTTVNLPSFGGGNGNDPNLPGRTATANANRGFDVTIVGTSRSGGGFNFYGLLKGDKTYTKYFETAVGTVTMWFSDPISASHPYAEEITAPEPMRADLPAGLSRSRLVIACNLDRAGVIRDIRVMEPGPPQMTAKVMASLPNWKFRPAFHGNDPIEVTAVLGFNVDTSR